MDWVGIVLLVMPVFLPIVLKLPVEEIGLTDALVAAPSFVAVWYGILFCVNMQVSFLSPPFGPAAFYLKSVAPPQEYWTVLAGRSEEHTSELQSLMRISYAVFCLKKKNTRTKT